MTKFPHDEFAKGLLESLLSPLGKVETSYKISSEVREIDLYFQSNSPLDPVAELGLLGELAKTDFILEPFRNPPTIFQIRACIGKLFDLHAYLIRDAKRNKRSEPKNEDLPMLWIVAPTLSQPILDEFGAMQTTQLAPSGIYIAPTGYKTGIIVVHQLPAIPATLWFRLLGKGRVQASAIAEVAALPEDCLGRQDALAWLGNLKVILEARESKEPEEEDLMMQLSPLFLEKIQAAEQQGNAKGREEEAQGLILRQLTRRLGNVSPQLQERVRALPLARLEELGEALLDFGSVADLEAWLGME